MNTKKTILTLLVLVLIASVSWRILAFADQKQDYSLEEVAEQIRQAHMAKLVYDENNQIIQIDGLEEDVSANTDLERILEFVYKYPESELAAHYGGAFINERGSLVIRLTCTDENCIRFLEENLLQCETEFTVCERALLPLEQIYNEANERISQINQRIVSNKSTTEEEKELMSRYPTVRLIDEQNRLIVFFSKEANINNIPDEKYLQDCRQLFERVVGKYDVDEYKIIAEEELRFESYTTTVYPGCGAFEIDHISGGTIYAYGISLGYRAMYADSSEIIYGFVSCGHDLSVGKDVYLSTVFSSTVYLGIVSAVMNSGAVDASFIRVTNSNFIGGLAIHYSSSSGQVLGGDVLDGTGINAAVGNTLYKSGQATYLTSGSIASIYGTGTFNGVYHYSLIQVNSVIGDHGDSGGIAYIRNSNNSYSKAAGIVLGGDSSNSYFIRYHNISNSFGPYAY